MQQIRSGTTLVLVVSNWNVKSWGLLEAFRGKDVIYLLCKDRVSSP